MCRSKHGSQHAAMGWASAAISGHDRHRRMIRFYMRCRQPAEPGPCREIIGCEPLVQVLAYVLYKSVPYV